MTSTTVLVLLAGLAFGATAAWAAAVVLWSRRRPPVHDPGEVLGRLLDANRALLEQERVRAASELDGKKSLIDQQLTAMASELGKVDTLVRELERDRRQAFGELASQLRRQHADLHTLSEHTQQLREALASSKVRGQWGERMAEDVLRLAGFLEGVNYRKQATLAGSGRPDYTFLLPNGLVLHMDVKFPLDNYVRYLEAGSEMERVAHRDAFLRDVRDRVKELTARGYLDAADETVDCLLLFIPNEGVYTFVQEHDRELLDHALRHKIVLCSPMTLYAVLAVIRQAVDNFRLSRTSNEILSLLGEFSRQWEKYATQLDRVQQRFDGVAKEFAALMTTRHRRSSARSTRSRPCATRSRHWSTSTRRPSPSKPEPVGSVRPMSHVCVLGGGQLGRMLGLAGIPLGCTFTFLDPGAAAPAGAVGELVVGALDDVAAAERAAKGASVVTYEWEGVPAGTARAAGRHADVHPTPVVLELSQDRLVEKSALRRLGIATADFAPVGSRAELDDAAAGLGYPAVLKTRRGGYDGKGQVVLGGPAGVDAAWAALGGAALIVEAFVPFARELSIVAVRGRDGDFRCWPVVENVHRDGILRVTRAPAPGLDDALQARAEKCVRPLMEQHDYVGVCCVELFDTGSELLANELAPRVHNSGHWTIEGAETSQFENHVRAVTGMPLGSTAARGPAAMVNCIGRMPDRDAVLRVPGAHLHDYGKHPRPGRKVGHVTVTADDPATLAERLGAVTALCDGAGLP
jgi:5-(carboxyamino)imidazole ribonucleotide synthase